MPPKNIEQDAVENAMLLYLETLQRAKKAEQKIGEANMTVMNRDFELSRVKRERDEQREELASLRRRFSSLKRNMEAIQGLADRAVNL